MHIASVILVLICLWACVQSNLIDEYKWKTLITDINYKINSHNIFELLDNNKCTDHFALYLDNFNKSVDWANRMFDSSTKIPENLLMGQTIFLGNFDECIAVKYNSDEHGSFTGKHCLATFLPYSMENIKTSTIQQVIKQRKRSEGNSIRNIDFLLKNDWMISLSYCIPSSCSSKNFEDALNMYLYLNNISIFSVIPEEYCHTSEGKSFRTEDWVTVGILIFILALAVLSTGYDLVYKGEKKEILTTFSLIKNGKKLLSTKSSGDTLQAMHGMRFITMCWVVWGHRYSVDSGAPAINVSSVIDFIQDVGRLYITNGTISVDTFLFLSGLLVSYVFLNQMAKGTSKFNILLYYLHRYIRLTPPYALVILLEATLLRYITAAPLFTGVINLMSENCQKYWWTNIIYVNNYVKTENICIGQSWYLSVDMQLFILSPILLYPLMKLPAKYNIVILSSLILAGIFVPFTISYVEEYSANLLTGNIDRQAEEQKYLYLATHSRFGPWVIGFAFGYLIYESKRKDIQLSGIHITIAWIISNVCLLGALNGAYTFYQLDIEKTVLESAFYNGLFRNVWALGVGVTLYLCVRGYGGPPNALLSWKIFPTVSRLTYCMYLTHASYQIIQTFSAKAAIEISDFRDWPLFFGDVIVSLVLATILSLFVEAPTIALERFLLGKSKQNTTQIEDNLQEGTASVTLICDGDSAENLNSAENGTQISSTVLSEMSSTNSMEQQLITK